MEHASLAPTTLTLLPMVLASACLAVLEQRSTPLVPDATFVLLETFPPTMDDAKHALPTLTLPILDPPSVFLADAVMRPTPLALDVTSVLLETFPLMVHVKPASPAHIL